MRGFFISLEGPDGSGKTTQFEKIGEALKKEGYAITLSREPGGTAVGESIRDILLDTKTRSLCPKAEALLYAAARAQNVAEVIEPALKKGHVVLCDRFVYSSYVYQGVARGLGMDAIAQVNDFATGRLYPELTLYYQISFEESLRRLQGRGPKDRMEAEKESFHRQVFEGYEQVLLKYQERLCVVDGRGSLDEVYERSMSLIRSALEKWRVRPPMPLSWK